MVNGPSNFFFDAFHYQFMGKIGVGIRNKFLRKAIYVESLQ